MSGPNRERRKRRQSRQWLSHGRKAKPGHKLPSGRTGKVHHKRRAAERDGAERATPKPAEHNVTRYRLTVRAGQVVFEVIP